MRSQCSTEMDADAVFVLLFMQSRTLAHTMVPTFTVGVAPVSVKALLKCPHRVVFG